MVQAANHLSPASYNFMEKPGAVALAETSTTVPVYLDTQGIVNAARAGANIAVWRFDPPIDIDNDGTPDNVILWRGKIPPVWEQCGQSESYGLNMEGPTVLFVTANDSGIDSGKTAQTFQDLVSMQYAPLRHSIGVFRYREQYYFDAFINKKVSVTGNLSTPTKDLQYLHVFHLKGEKVEQVCQFVNKDPLDGTRVDHNTLFNPSDDSLGMHLQ